MIDQFVKFNTPTSAPTTMARRQTTKQFLKLDLPTIYRACFTGNSFFDLVNEFVQIIISLQDIQKMQSFMAALNGEAAELLLFSLL